MKVVVLTVSTYLLAGCGHNPFLQKVEVDDRLMQPCPQELPRLKTADDTDSLEWSASMLKLYSDCAKEKKTLVKVIEDFNSKVAK